MIKITIVTCVYADEDGREQLVSVRPSMELAIEEVEHEINELTYGKAHTGDVKYNGEFGNVEIANIMQGKRHMTYFLREEELL